MKILITFVSLVFCFFATVLDAAAKTYQFASPDGRLAATVEVDDQVHYSISFDGKLIVAPSLASIELADGTIWGENPRVRKTTSLFVDEELRPLYGKRSVIRDQYNQLTIDFRGNYSMDFRLYNEGFAYRFKYNKKETFEIKNEHAEVNFTDDFEIWASHQRSASFEHSYEDFYTRRKLSALSDSMMMLPLLARSPEGVNLLITESDLEDYPGFHMVRSSTAPNGLKAVFPKVPTRWEPGGHMNFNLIVKERTDYIARTEGVRTFPWRIIKVAENDIQLLDTDIVYKLSDAPDESIDFSWVQPGKVAWDWWCAVNLVGVDFRSGVNTESYKYYIDFAAENGIEYINLDEGWSDQYDLMKLDEQINLREIMEYAHEKGVGVFLWCVHWPLDEKLEEAMAQFKELGVKGLKIDFMDRDDQVMVNYYHRIARAAAEHKLLVNYHGAYKPAGLHRKYPNVINRESVRGLEYNKFSVPHGTTPAHAVTIPFIRMAAGPMDYTPGAMTNAQKANFGVYFERPMSQGTRCQQLAMFVVYEAPLQMLADAPTAYNAEPDILEFLREVPTTWDETVALDGRVGEYVIIARKAGDDWYVGGMTDWEPRVLEVDLSFLGDGDFNMQLFLDGINADRIGNDYKMVNSIIGKEDKQTIHLGPGGGFVMKISAR